MGRGNISRGSVINGMRLWCVLQRDFSSHLSGAENFISALENYLLLWRFADRFGSGINIFARCLYFITKIQAYSENFKECFSDRRVRPYIVCSLSLWLLNWIREIKNCLFLMSVVYHLNSFALKKIVKNYGMENGHIQTVGKKRCLRRSVGNVKHLTQISGNYVQFKFFAQRRL